MTQYIRAPAIRPSLPGSLPAAAVFGGDILVLLAFTAAGIYDHGGDPFSLPVHTLEATAPFLIAWLLIAPLVGVYHHETLTNYRVSVLLIVGTWLIVVVVGAGIRSTSYFPGDAPVTFVLVAMLFGSLFLLSWRLVAVWIHRRIN